MRSGLLRKRITIQSASSARDNFGAVENTWSDVGSRWASVEPLSAGEFEVSGQTVNRKEIKFVMRYTTSITAQMRLVFDNENYNIESIININQRNRELELLCTRITT